MCRPSLGFILIIGLFVSFLLPRLKAAMGAIVSVGLLLVLLGTGLGSARAEPADRPVHQL